MIYFILFALGLCFGSFVNAAAWRVHQQTMVKKGKSKKDLSIVHGRSMCPHCRHELAALDLVPVLSWLSLRGRCRYCRKAISLQYPLVEIASAVLFAGSYRFWPEPVAGIEAVYFILWLVILVGFVFLAVYDVRWFLLPDRVVFPLMFVAATLAVIRIVASEQPSGAVVSHLVSVAIAGGIFWVLYQVSAGRWIGGGDVKLGVVLGLLLGNPYSAVVMLFLASFIGVFVVLPSLVIKRISFGSKIPFGPFLMIATTVMLLFGPQLIQWYENQFLVL